MFRLYYRRILGIFYVILSFIYTIYRMGSGLTIGDIFISISFYKQKMSLYNLFPVFVRDYLDIGYASCNRFSDQVGGNKSYSLLRLMLRTDT